MKKQIYIETSIASYLTARPNRDLIKTARQELTAEWWEQRRENFELCTSELVLEEAARGDPVFAEKRLAVLRDLRALALTEDVAKIADALVVEGPMPARAADDAVHLAVAAVHEMDFMLTWNCRHLANSEMTGAISDLLRLKGYRPPVICTPETLMGD